MAKKEKATSPEKKAALEAIRAQCKGTTPDTQFKRLLETLRQRGYQIVAHWQDVQTEAGDPRCLGLYGLEGGHHAL